MKIYAVCQDKNGMKFNVLVDLDYVDVNDYDKVKNWCYEEIIDQNYAFDVNNFSVIDFEKIKEL